MSPESEDRPPVWTPAPDHLEEMDRNARAYGWEIGRGKPLVVEMVTSPGNPFMEPNWREALPENATPVPDGDGEAVVRVDAPLWGPQGVDDKGSLTLDEAVGQAIGAAGMAWENVGAAGTFDDEWAKAVHDGLMAYLSDKLDEVRAEASEAALAKFRVKYGFTETQHVLRVTEDGRWVIQHPLECRPDLFACSANDAVYSGSLDPGQWYFRVEDGLIVLGEGAADSPKLDVPKPLSADKDWLNT